jgi:hypothetical protein
MSEHNSRPTPPDVLEQATAALRGAPVPAGPPAALAAATVAAVQDRLARAEPRTLNRRRVMRIIGYGSLATAAAVALGVGLTGGTASALDKAADKAAAADAVTYVAKEKLGTQAEIESKHSLRGHRARIELAGGTTVLVVDTKAREALMTIPPLKVYEKSGPNTPGPRVDDLGGKTAVAALLALRGKKPEYLGREEAGGVRAVKLKVMEDRTKSRQEPIEWTLWLDPATDLPVKMQKSGTTFAGGKEVPTTTVFERFEWNPKLEDKLFDMTPPAGFKEGLPFRKP